MCGKRSGSCQQQSPVQASESSAARLILVSCMHGEMTHRVILGTSHCRAACRSIEHKGSNAGISHYKNASPLRARSATRGYSPVPGCFYPLTVEYVQASWYPASHKVMLKALIVQSDNSGKQTTIASNATCNRIPLMTAGPAYVALTADDCGVCFCEYRSRHLGTGNCCV